MKVLQIFHGVESSLGCGACLLVEECLARHHAHELQPGARFRASDLGVDFSAFVRSVFGFRGWFGCGVLSLGFGVWGSEFGAWGLGFGIWGLECEVWGLGFLASVSGFRSSEVF